MSDEVQVRRKCPEHDKRPVIAELSDGTVIRGRCHFCSGDGYTYEWLSLEDAVQKAHTEECKRVGKLAEK